MARRLRLRLGMNRQPLRTMSLVLIPLVVTTLACAEEDSVDIADESTETGEEDDGASSEPGGDTRGPSVEIMVDGEPLSGTLRSAGELQLRAEAEAPSGIDAVEFYLDDQLLSVDESEPYTAYVAIPDASFNGQRSLIARAYDSNGNMAESSLPLSIALPESGAVEWEYIGPGAGQRWVFVGAEDSALVFDRSSVLRISAEGELLSSHEFTYDVSAVTHNGLGPIAVGVIDGTLVIQRFNNEGVPLYLELVEGFGTADTSITDVVLGHGQQLVISSLSSMHVDGEDVDTARISCVTYGTVAAVQWHRPLLRDGQPTDSNRVAHVAVAPNGSIYATPTFEVTEFSVYLQLLGIADSHTTSTFEYLVNYRSSFNDVVATNEYVFVAARLNDLAAIQRFDASGVADAIFYLDADVATVLEPAGDDLVYAALMPGDGTKLGRISAYGAERWSKQLGGDDIVHDIAVTSVGHMYVASEWDSAAWRLRRIHP